MKAKYKIFDHGDRNEKSLYKYETPVDLLNDVANFISEVGTHRFISMMSKGDEYHQIQHIIIWY
jgi:hypothetical protein